MTVNVFDNSIIPGDHVSNLSSVLSNLLDKKGRDDLQINEFVYLCSPNLNKSTQA